MEKHLPILETGKTLAPVVWSISILFSLQLVACARPSPLKVTRAWRTDSLITRGPSVPAPQDNEVLFALEFVLDGEDEVRIRSSDVLLKDSQGNSHLPMGFAPFSVFDVYETFDGKIVGSYTVEDSKGGIIAIACADGPEGCRDENDRGGVGFTVRGPSSCFSLLYAIPKDSSPLSIEVLRSKPIRVGVETTAPPDWKKTLTRHYPAGFERNTVIRK